MLFSPKGIQRLRKLRMKERLTFILPAAWEAGNTSLETSQSLIVMNSHKYGDTVILNNTTG